MERFESLRDSPLRRDLFATYLEQGRYAEAIVSTGAEPDLSNAAPPARDVLRRARAAFLPGPTGRTPAGAAIGRLGITLFDADGDGDLDLFEIGRDGARLLPQRRAAGSVDETPRAGLTVASRTWRSAAIAGDYDNDGRPDLLLLGDDGLSAVSSRRPMATFEDVTSATGLPARPRAVAAAAFVGRAITTATSTSWPVAGPRHAQLLRNNGNGTFTDITRGGAAGGAASHAIAIVPTDFDNRRDIDLLVADRRRGRRAVSKHARRHVPGRRRRRPDCRRRAATTALARRRRQQGRISGPVSSAGVTARRARAQRRPRTIPPSSPRPTSRDGDGRGAVGRLRQRRPARSADAAPDGACALVPQHRRRPMDG